MPNPKKTIKLLAIFFALFAGFVINSCRRDNQPVPNTGLPPAIALAKSWYESTYAASSASSQHLTTQSTGTGAHNAVFDFSQHIRPDWSHPSAYKRFGQNVIEMPIDLSSAKIGAALGNMPGGKAVYQNKYSRSSFLLLNDSSGYSAYIMTVIADSSYLKNDLKKLDRDKYNQRDSDFSGVVLYFTPKGAFVSGWFYKNGSIIAAMSASEKNYTAAAMKTTTSSTSKLKVNMVQAVEVCQDWYQTVTVNGVVMSTTYLDTTCTTYFVDDGGGGGTAGGGTIGTGGSTSSGGGGTPVSTTTPCSTSAPAGASVGGGHLAVDMVQPQPAPGATGGTGFPAPTSDPCSTVTSETVTPVDTIAALIKQPTALTNSQIVSLQTVLNQILADCIGQTLYNYFDNNKTTFTFTVNNQSAYPAFYNPVSGGITIQNIATLTPQALEEEFFHAYQNATMAGGTAQYAGTTGDANIEFEAKVLKDISLNIDLINGNGAGGPMTLNDPNYYNWLSSITDSFSKYPTSFTQNQLNEYFSFMTEFIQDTGYSNDIENPNLLPTAMFSLINSSPCLNPQ